MVNIETLPEISFYENFYNNRVKPKIEKDMGDCEGFFPWLAEYGPELYNKINEAEQEIDSLWLNQADKDSFKAACKTWYNLLMEAKKGFEAWKAKKREALLLSGRQEAMALR